MSKITSAKVPLWKKLAWGAGGAADYIMYNGVSSLVLPIFGGYILAATRFDQTLAVQGPETIFRLRLWFMLVVVFCLLLSALVISFYPITHARALAVRSELEKRGKPHKS